MLRLDRHPLGPRVFAFGRRIHEWHLGLAIVAVVLGGRAAGAWHLTLVPALLAAAGGWLILKDWRDLVPAKRDTYSWRIGLTVIPRRCGRIAARTACLRSPRASPSRSVSSTCSRR